MSEGLDLGQKKDIYRDLLKKYCDALIDMMDRSDDPAFFGGIRCRACKMIHGRCPDAVYGFTVMGKISGEKKYLQAAENVFDYGENLLCKDGALYNDAQATWRYTTTFHEIAVIEALRTGKGIFSESTIQKFEKRAKRMANWLYQNLDEHSPANINYCTTNGLAMALAGNYFGEKNYLERAAKLVNYAMAHLTENGLLYGECKPHDALSKKGCRGIDIGYNVEESVPALVKYAFEVGDKPLQNKLIDVVREHLAFMLPDGAWDNTFGDRNNKWTYWGSRTSDGCAPMFLLLADKDKSFAAAAYRNTMLLDKCSPDGLLQGGVDYKRHGEHACTHHTFEHVNSIAFAVEHIDEKYLTAGAGKIPADNAKNLRYYPECRTYKLAEGDYLATITDNDFNVTFSGHATGGTLTALYHKEKGAFVMASVTDYKLAEPTNMQLPLDVEHHRSLVPRFAYQSDGKIYHSSNFTEAEMAQGQTKDGTTIFVKTGLEDENCQAAEGISLEIGYTLTKDGLSIAAKNVAKGVSFILPLICGQVQAQKGVCAKKEQIFFLTGGFIATEYTFTADEKGEIQLSIA